MEWIEVQVRTEETQFLFHLKKGLFSADLAHSLMFYSWQFRLSQDSLW